MFLQLFRTRNHSQPSPLLSLTSRAAHHHKCNTVFPSVCAKRAAGSHANLLHLSRPTAFPLHLEGIWGGFSRCPTLWHFNWNALTAVFFFFLSFSNSLTRGSTIKISRINVPTATVPTQTLHHCRFTCQHMPSKMPRPTAVACAAGHTPQ